jgi:ATP-dependent Lhr-like helicase
VAAERLHELMALFPGATPAPRIDAVVRETPPREDALRELLRSRLELLGPATAAALAAPLGLAADEVGAALLRLQAEGAAMHGGFTEPGADEWCDRRLLARMHRRTRDRRRAAVDPVPPAQFMRFLLRWQGVSTADGDARRAGDAGLLDVLRQLEGCAAPPAAWEDDLLPARVKDYDAAMLDRLCAAGRVAWWRPTAKTAERAGDEEAAPRSGPVRGTPVLLVEREALAHWRAAGGEPAAAPPLSGKARAVRDALQAHGASFVADLRHDAGLLGVEVEQALGELVAHGLVTCDSFAGLRALVMPADVRQRLRRRRPGHEPIDEAGRWSLVRAPRAVPAPAGALAAPRVEHIARVLLRRWGVVFRRLLEREDGLPPWRELHYVYRRLEARGEIRGGRFVSGFSGEQFALPEAATALRRTTRPPVPERIALAAVDPLNLAGIVTPGERIARVPGHRVLLEDGVPIAVHAGGALRCLTPLDERAQWEVRQLLVRSRAAGRVTAAAAA